MEVLKAVEVVISFLGGCSRGQGVGVHVLTSTTRLNQRDMRPLAARLEQVAWHSVGFNLSFVNQ